MLVADGELYLIRDLVGVEVFLGFCHIVMAGISHVDRHHNLA